METLTLLRPLWLWGLLAVPVWIALWRWRRHRIDPWRSVCDVALLQAQQIGAGGKDYARLLWLLIAYVLTLVALAGPSLGREPQPLSQNSDALIIALDLSQVMRAGDLKPDRLSRARFKLTALLRQRKAGQTALIAYAGEAFTVAPLTDDLSTLDNLLQALDPSVMPISGQRPERAIRMATQMLDDASLSRARLLLLASASSADAERAAAEAQQRGLTVSVLGVGTTQGAPVPVGGGGFLQDANGGILLPKLDDEALNDLAEAGGGSYRRIADDESDLRALGVMDQNRTAADDEVVTDQSMTQPRDDGPWVLLFLLPLVAMAMRRGVLWSVVLAAPLLSSPQVSQASVWDDLWQRPDQQAWQALQSDDPARARELAQDPVLRGSAAYRAQDFTAAAEDFARGEGVESDYNRGTALAKAQRYEEALAAFDEVLKRDPSHGDAKANRDAVAQWLEQQKQQEKPDQPKSGEGGQGGEGDPSEGKPEDGDQGESGEPQDGEPQEGDSSGDKSGEQGESQGSEAGDEQASAQDQSDASTDPSASSEQDFQQEMQQALDAQDKESDQAQKERQASAAVSAEQISEAEREQAMQQLLRRVPDDPGGLLRRKFILEYQRRQQEGSER